MLWGCGLEKHHWHCSCFYIYIYINTTVFTSKAYVCVLPVCIITASTSRWWFRKITDRWGLFNFCCPHPLRIGEIWVPHSENHYCWGGGVGVSGGFWGGTKILPFVRRGSHSAYHRRILLPKFQKPLPRLLLFFELSLLTFFGIISILQNLSFPSEHWQNLGVPLLQMAPSGWPFP